MKKFISLGLGALAMAMAATPALAIEGLTANAAVTSDYVFRGITQSASDPAVQAGLDYDLGTLGLSGFSVGTWVSSIKFGDTSPMELDLYGSYTGNITDKFSWSAGGIVYLYPSSTSGTNYNWMEGWGGLSYNFGFAALTGKVFYSPDYVNLGTHQIYYNGGVSIPIAPWLSLNGSYGFTDIGKDVFPIIKDYSDWSVSLAATYQAYTLTLGYTSTDLDGPYEVNTGVPFQTTEQFFVMFGFKFM